MTLDVDVYLRDASWWDHPDTRAVRRFHRESSKHPGMAACDGARIMLVMERPWSVEDAPGTALCGRCFPRGGSSRH